MALAMMKVGAPRTQILEETGISNAIYADLFALYESKNIDAVTTSLTDTWGMLLLAKVMGTTEKAIDKIDTLMDEDRMKDAKMASEIFEKLFGSFRLSTGKSTENTHSVVTRFNDVIESRRKLTQPNQSIKELDVITVQ